MVALLGLLIGQAAPMYGFIAHSAAISDTTPVTVHTFTVSANTANVDSEDVHLVMSGTVSDNLSGFSSMQVYYTSPSGHQVAEGQMTDSTDSSFTADVTIPRYAEAGVWTPTATFVDAATNVLTLTSQELANKGFALDVTVTSTTPDTIAPNLANFTVVGSQSIDVLYDQAFVETDIFLPDNLSGVAQDGQSVGATIKYISPSGNQSYSATFQTTASPDEYSAVITIPQHVESGIWLAQLTVTDKAGNTRVYDANDLNSLGFATALTLTSEEDTTPVSVTSMKFVPLQQDFYDTATTFTGGPLATMQLNISDDYSGVTEPSLIYRSSTTSQVSTSEGWSMYNDSSTEQHQFLINLPKYAAEGDWLPELTVSDQAGNTRLYTYSDLLALGFDMKVTIGDNVTQSVDAGDTVSTDVNGSGATASQPVQASVTSPVPGDVSVTAVDTASTEGDFTGYSLLPQQYSISAPLSTPEEPLVLTFTIDSSLLGGVNPDDITIFRDGTSVGQCLNSDIADPDACVRSISSDVHGDVSIVVNSSHASQWMFGTKQSDQPEFTFQGFGKPVAIDTLNENKAGSAIPVKFSLGGDFGLDVLAAGYPISQEVDCTSLDSKGDETATVTTNKQDLMRSGSADYRYDWKTLKSWKGTCRELKFTFRTGESASAYFKFK